MLGFGATAPETFQLSPSFSLLSELPLLCKGNSGVRWTLSFRASPEGRWMGSTVLFLKGI